MEYEVSHWLALSLFASFILLLFTGYPVAWIMGGVSDNLNRCICIFRLLF